ncbi:MAG: aminotransferase DegT [Chloroflexi bacterium]|nr:aminotransferase DegT [Chloroflexota bacterium]|tara:strand:+ start:23571 stop:24755 length:1185 start_codon:yes stop_codon:yes gene_type:complete
MKSEHCTSTPKEFIPLCEPYITGNEWSYVKDCLDTSWVSTSGSYIEQFENKFNDYIGSKYSIATSSGTSALHTSLIVAGVQENEEVLVSTLSFIAPANAIRYIGAWPVFIDADPSYWQMDPDKVDHFIACHCEWKSNTLVNKTTNRRIAAILPVHILGYPCDLDPLLEISRRYNLPLIEDATESLGAKYKGKKLGCSSDIACFSFNGNKLITTGGGGMITTNNSHWAQKAKHITTQAKDEPVEYIHSEIGYNYRLSNVQAAIGLGQIEHIGEFIQRKILIYNRYQQHFQSHPTITLLPKRPDSDPVYWLNTILLDENITLDQRKAFVNTLNNAGIGVRPLWHPLHALPLYADYTSYHIEHSLNIYRRAISIPSSVGLSESDQLKCISSINRLIA